MKTSMIRHFIFLLLISFFWSPLSQAARIAKVKGRKVYILTQGDSFKKGDRVYAFSKGKKRALIQIVKVKGNKAYAILRKGKVQKGYTVRPKGSSVARSSRKSAPSSGGGDYYSSDKSYWGAIAGFSMDSMTAEVSSVSESLSGSGFSAKAFFDYPIFSQIWFRGMAGYEGFGVSGDTSAGCNSSTCEVTIGYLTFDLIGRYIFPMGNFVPWVGGGFDLLFPLTKSATAVDESTITNTNLFVGAVGVDWYLSRDTFVPIQVEYGLFPSSETVTANMMAIRVGFGWSL